MCECAGMWVWCRGNILSCVVIILRVFIFSISASKLALSITLPLFVCLCVYLCVFLCVHVCVCMIVCIYVLCMYLVTRVLMRGAFVCMCSCHVRTWLHASSCAAVSASISSCSASMSAFSMTLASCVSVSSVLVTWSSSVSSSTSCWYRVNSSLWDERARLRSDFSCSTALWWFWIWWRRRIKLRYDVNKWK